MTALSRTGAILAALTLLLALGGCGLKGDLYLPEDEPAAESADAEDDAEEDAGT